MLQDFNNKYRYISDTTKFGRVEHWTVIKPDADGLYRGDCEDYVLTLKDKIDGFADIDLFYCRINGNGHCVGVRGNMIIDCNARAWMDIESYTRTYNMTDLKKYNWFVLLFKKIQAKIQRGLNYVREMVRSIK